MILPFVRSMVPVCFLFSILSFNVPVFYVLFDKIVCDMSLKCGLKVPIFAPLREGGTVLRNDDIR